MLYSAGTEKENYLFFSTGSTGSTGAWYSLKKMECRCLQNVSENRPRSCAILRGGCMMRLYKNNLKCVQEDEIQKGEKGFTLLELLAVLALLAVLVAITLPHVGTLSRWKLNGAAKILVGNLRLARQEAIAGGYSKVVFYIYSNSYELRLSQKNSTVYLPQGVSFKGLTTFPGKPPSVHFNMLGHPKYRRDGCAKIVRRRKGIYYYDSGYWAD
jgi:prepilin-type N-terminal cleavage/methylation domain-containing protein